MARKRAPGGGRKAGELGLKSATLSLRLPENMRTALVAAAKRARRRFVSEEIVIRLNSTLVRDRGEADRPRHIRALAEVVARLASELERRTGRPWIEDRYTQEQLSKAIDLLLHTYSHGEAVTPPPILAETERVPAEARQHYTAQVGESAASGIIASLTAAPKPPDHEMPPGYYYPESWWSLWQLEQDLTQKPRRRK